MNYCKKTLKHKFHLIMNKKYFLIHANNMTNTILFSNCNDIISEKIDNKKVINIKKQILEKRPHNHLDYPIQATHQYDCKICQQ